MRGLNSVKTGGTFQMEARSCAKPSLRLGKQGWLSIFGLLLWKLLEVVNHNKKPAAPPFNLLGRSIFSRS